jgi:hypothetical protein
VALLGLLVLVGWLGGVPALKSVLPGAVEMKANTAVALVLASLSIYLHTRERTVAPCRGLSHGGTVNVSMCNL